MWENQGIQVVITAHNTSEYLERCLGSVSNSLQGRKWILVFSDDGSSDDTYEKTDFLSKDFNRFIIKNQKAKNYAQAANRALELSFQFKEEYPAIMIMDSDDEMLPGRAALVDYLARNNEIFVFGDYYLEKGGSLIEVRPDRIPGFMRFGAWATVFHQSLIKKDIPFFEESLAVNPDLGKWWYLKCVENVKLCNFPGHFTHRYIKRSGSVSYGAGPKESEQLKNYIDKICPSC